MSDPSTIELLTKVASLTMLIFMVSNMLAFGMRLSPSEILPPLRDGRHNFKVFLANFVIMPAFAYVLLHAIHAGRTQWSVRRRGRFSRVGSRPLRREPEAPGDAARSPLNLGDKA
jgi:hypothetical protein